ncbi:MAG: polyketide synthase dehydratase domain-containing protein [Planctomycetaceae bacterium]|nr:polyketide synthase dehydratase domain-containing protein [Planctomycetaceae bacterium]
MAVGGGDIAIVGMACVFPRAANMRQYWSNLVNGVDAVEDIPADRWRGCRNQELPEEHEAYIPCGRGGFIPSDIWFDSRRYGVLPNAVRHGDADQFLMIHVVDEALRDAGIFDEDPLRTASDLIIGRGGYVTSKQTELTLRAEVFETVLEMIDRKYPDLLAGSRRSEVAAYLRSTLSPNEVESVSTAISNIVASRAANRLNLRGACFTVDAACASSLVAVEYAMSRLRGGLSDVAVAAGVFMNHSATFWHVFTRLGALSRNGIIRPFDRRADGLVIGDGAGAIVLKRLEDAVRNGDEIYAVIKGVGSSGDGRALDVLAPSSAGQVEALKRAYADAGIDPLELGYLELHGTGTVAGDMSEIETIKTFFGRSASPPTQRCMGSVKSMIGHTMPASGMASIIKVALSLSNKIIPPSLHCEEPREELADAAFFMNTQCRPWVHPSSSGPRLAAVNAFGFGGVNVHLVMQEVDTRVEGRRAKKPKTRPFIGVRQRPDELFAFAADDVPSLIAKLESWSDFVREDRSLASPADFALTAWNETSSPAAVRLAFLASDRDSLAERLETCLTSLRADKPDFTGLTDTWYCDQPRIPDGLLAFIFPGMGFPGLIGTYPDHLMEMCLQYPEVRAEFDNFEDRDRHPDDNVPTSSIFWPPSSLPESYRQTLRKRLAPPRTDDQEVDPDARPDERYLSAMGVTLSNWVSWILLQRFGVKPDMIAGQSQGEMAAVCAAGSADFQSSAPSYWKVLNVDWRDAKGERMAFAWASAERLEPLFAQHPGTHFAIHIAPEAVIFGGPPASLHAIADELRKDGVLVQILPYPPIHTPRLSYLRDDLLATLRDSETPLRRPKIPLYSSITAKPYPKDPKKIPETLLLNLDHPLQIWQTIQRMYNDGARLFVQAGGGQLASSLPTLLPGRDDLKAVALDVDEVDPVSQLHRLLASLFVAGVPIDLRALFDNRPVEAVDRSKPGVPPVPPKTAVPYRIDWSPLLSPNVPPKQPRQSVDAVAAETPSMHHDTDVETNMTSETMTAEPAPAEEASPLMTDDGADIQDDAVAMEVAADKSDVEDEFVDNNPIDPGPALTDEDFAAANMPFLGTILEYEPGRQLVMERMLDVEEDWFLHDHTFVHAPGIKPVSECLPIQPMTFGIELIAEAASVLCVGKGLIGFENIRASRWIGLVDKERQVMTIRASTLSEDAETGIRRVEVSVEFEGVRSLSGTALFADGYRNDLHVEIAPCEDGPDWTATAFDVYDQRLMFHGPTLQVISKLDRMGNPSFDGELLVAPKNELFRSFENPTLLTDPCLMDGVGQFLGLWLQLHDWFVLPTGLERMEICCDTPPVGSSVPIRVELTEFDEELKRTKCDIIVEDGQGGVWLKIIGWSDWIFKWSPRFAAWIRNPYVVTLSDEVPATAAVNGASCRVLTKEHLKKGDLDRGSRIAMHSEEMAELLAISDANRQWQQLASRVVVKEAIRDWYVKQGETTSIHPAMLRIRHDESGRPYPTWGDDPCDLKISLAHTDNAAVAFASHVDAGVDMELLTRDVSDLLSRFATSEELELLSSLPTESARTNWPLRLWCAKESAAKLMGTGLQGAPKDFEVVDAEDDRELLVQHLPTGFRTRVHLLTMDDYLIAYTDAHDIVLDGELVQHG